jgi:CheY-like chemotaxis protein
MKSIVLAFLDRPGFLRNGLVVRSNSGDGNWPLLHIDDSANDRLLVKEAILLSKIPFNYYGADSLESAVEYFDYRGNELGAKQFPHPELVLLDYDMGRNTGADFLHWLREMEEITSIPVVMFSGSVGQPHIAECYAAGADHFISKPKNLTRLKTIVRALHLSMMSHRSSPILRREEYQPDPRGLP